jgi:predicted TIM-barrel fold metal-dependent hydrolase
MLMKKLSRLPSNPRHARLPLITPQKWLAAFTDLPLKDEVRPKILEHNAVRLLGL